MRVNFCNWSGKRIGIRIILNGNSDDAFFSIGLEAVGVIACEWEFSHEIREIYFEDAESCQSVLLAETGIGQASKFYVFPDRIEAWQDRYLAFYRKWESTYGSEPSELDVSVDVTVDLESRLL